MNLWPLLVGEPWCSRSRPVFIDAEARLVVAVSDAVTAQELSLLKPEIYRKLKAAGRSIGVDLSGLRFDLKRYHGGHSEDGALAAAARHLPEATADELAAIALPEADLAQLAKLSADLSGLREESELVSSERVVTLFERELRLRHWMKANGYPICSRCRSPVRSLRDPDRLCVPCSQSGL